MINRFPALALLFLSPCGLLQSAQPLSRNGAPPEIVPGEGSEVIVDAAVKLAREGRGANQRFFSVVHFGSPHDPSSGKPDDTARYAKLGAPLGHRFAEMTAMDRAIGTMRERPSPIGFWKYASQGESQYGRWISEELPRGTTPTTRNPAIAFINYKHPVAKTRDFGGEAAWRDNRYKLIVGESRRAKAGPRTELYDLLAAPKETTNLAAQHPAIVQRITEQLHTWQRSVERRLSGADY